MMTATAFNQTTPSSKPPKTVGWTEFKRNYLLREDRYKYEWVNGTVEKTLRSMDRTQIFIQNNLLNFFYQLKATTGISGNLIAEGDTFFAGNHRRPDMAYYTDDQIETGRKDEEVSPAFVIGVISNQDQMNKVHAKMKDYRAANVQVIWHIFPKLEEVHVYHGKNMVVCLGDDICSAQPVIAGFEMTVKDVLK